MEKQTFVIKSFTDVMRVHSYLGQHHSEAVNDGKPLVVRVDQKQETRTLAQNRLMHLWFGEIANSTGDSAESVKYDLKLEFLRPIVLRDSEEARLSYQAYQNARQDIIDLQSIDIDKALSRVPSCKQQFKDFVNNHLRTSKVSTKQLSEFMQSIDVFASVKLGVHLTIPDDLMWVME